MNVVGIRQHQAAGQGLPGTPFDLPVRRRLPRLVASMVEPPFQIGSPLFDRCDPFEFDRPRPLGRIPAGAG
jgi:hypothetical protein